MALTQAGARPHTVLSSLLQQDPDTAASSKSISNAKTKRRTEYLSGQSPIEALSSHLKNLTGNIAIKWMLRIKAMPFFAHPSSVQLARTKMM